MSLEGAGRPHDIRVDLLLIADMVAPKSRVLDIGCGDGALLDYLVHRKGVDGRGMELSQDGVNACVRQGLSVVQGDADIDLADYPSAAFDYVILSQTLQATRHPGRVLLELLRIGRRAIVSFPNFGHWRVRLDLLFGGRMPRTDLIRQPWYETPNIHLCTIRDFEFLCRDLDIVIERRLALNSHGGRAPNPRGQWLANLLSEQAVYLLHKG
jgi:methionine biosynthesis protein MetW